MRTPVFTNGRLPRDFYGRSLSLPSKENSYLILMLVAAALTLIKGLTHAAYSTPDSHSLSLASLLYFLVLAVTFRLALGFEKERHFFSPRFGAGIPPVR